MLETYEGGCQCGRCRVCGTHAFYVPRSDPDKIDVNARCLDGVDAAALTPQRFDGRHWEAAMTAGAPWRRRHP